MLIYTKQELSKPNLFQNLLGKHPKENAEIEINNLLASNENQLKEVSIDSILEIASRYKIEFHEDNKEFRLALFSKYLKNCLNDQNLDDSEIESLKHLRMVLFLNEKDTSRMLQTEAEKIYSKNLLTVVESGTMTEQQKATLERIKSNLQLPDEIARKIYEKTSTDHLQKFLTGIVSDERLSPEEEKELNEIADRLGIQPSYDKKTTELLDLYRLYWQVENAEVPTLEPDISLKAGEFLHFKTFVNWLEYRKMPKRIDYGGPTARIKLAKGFYYRIGSISYRNVSADEMQTIDRGNLYITNQRLIFIGSMGNKVIPLSKVLTFKTYSNGIDVQRDSGKSPFLEFEKHTILCSMIMGRLLSEN